VVGVSPAATNYLSKSLKIKSDKIILIDNGVALPRLVSEDEKRSLKKELNIAEQEIVIGTTGRMHSDDNKRFSDLIKAFSLLIQKGISAKLVLVGDGRERKNYEKLVNDMKIADKVIFVGYQNDVAPFYAIFDLFSLVSSHESFGLVLAEAMLHKLPIVATRVGGMQYIVEDEKTGFLVEKYNVNEIASRLETLSLNYQLRKDFGLKGYERAMEHYTEQSYVGKIEKLYLSLIRQNNLK
jgi:glycosyltransferase involved in cell wall biosynthesis